MAASLAWGLASHWFESLYFDSRNLSGDSMLDVQELSRDMSRQCVTKREFIKEIDGRLKLHNSYRSERITRVTLHLLSLKFSQEQKKQFKKLLPPGIHGSWATVKQPGFVRSNMTDYLTPIKNNEGYKAWKRHSLRLERSSSR
ncbi:MAG: DUF2267 domain-containing protein [Nitrososphaerota archaeon]|nr:DUF2267 domain-containing protein [Nitrososphaerota archaeon]